MWRRVWIPCSKYLKRKERKTWLTPAATHLYDKIITSNTLFTKITWINYFVLSRCWRILIVKDSGYIPFLCSVIMTEQVTLYRKGRELNVPFLLAYIHTFIWANREGGQRSFSHESMSGNTPLSVKTGAKIHRHTAPYSCNWLNRVENAQGVQWLLRVGFQLYLYWRPFLPVKKRKRKGKKQWFKKRNVDGMLLTMSLWFWKRNLTNHEDIFVLLLAETGSHNFLTSRTVQIIIWWGWSASKNIYFKRIIRYSIIYIFAVCSMQKQKIPCFLLFIQRLFRPSCISQGP